MSPFSSLPCLPGVQLFFVFYAFFGVLTFAATLAKLTSSVNRYNELRHWQRMMEQVRGNTCICVRVCAPLLLFTCSCSATGAGEARAAVFEASLKSSALATAQSLLARRPAGVASFFTCSLCQQVLWRTAGLLSTMIVMTFALHIRTFPSCTPCWFCPHRALRLSYWRTCGSGTRTRMGRSTRWSLLFTSCCARAESQGVLNDQGLISPAGSVYISIRTSYHPSCCGSARAGCAAMCDSCVDSPILA